jgi:hypothetical protein
MQALSRTHNTTNVDSTRLTGYSKTRRIISGVVQCPKSRAGDAPPTPPQNYSTLLKDVTIYTSLESCAQCSGIMCLGSVKDIVYLQWDQSQFLVGNIMWRATTTEQMGFTAPRPVRGDEFGFEYFTKLNKAADAFDDEVPNNPFYTQGGFTNASPTVTPFLCTDAARAIYSEGDTELAGWTTSQYPDYQPTPTSLTNQQVLDQARDFRIWVGGWSSRGARVSTPADDSGQARTEERQLRLGLGQLLRYRHHLSATGQEAHAVLAVEHRPRDPLGQDLCDELGITLVWPDVLKARIRPAVS